MKTTTIKTCVLSVVLTAFFATTDLFAQPPWLVNGNTDGQLGGNPPRLGTRGFNPLQFITFNIERMRITPIGRVGIGTNFTNPLHLLDVRNGDINTGNGTATSPQGYMIGDNYVLRHRGIVSSINVGVQAGPVNTGANNVFVGNQTGLSNAGGSSNVFIGWRSGASNVTGNWNTFTGLLTGADNTGSGNSFYGKDAGMNNTTGGWNAFIGAHSGQINAAGSDGNSFVGTNSGTNNNGDGNVIVGAWAGFNNNGDRNILLGLQSAQDVSGNDNIIIGGNAGSNAANSGSSNIFLGRNSGFSNIAGSNNIYIGNVAQGAAANQNSIAIGNNAIVQNNNHIILGTNLMRTGIGLSNDPLGPQNNLEIRATNFTTGTPIPVASGLRFRELTALSVPHPVANSTNTVLSVDDFGDVILVDDGGAGAADADWFDAGNPGFPPTDINARIYTFGNAGIGTENPTPQFKLHLHDKSGIKAGLPVRMIFTTEGQFSGTSTGTTIFDGFQINILGSIVPSGTAPFAAELKQMENAPMLFYTNAVERVRITEAGNVGINTPTPGNRVEIRSTTLNPKPSGLRFTNLTSASAPEINPSGNVLSVDPNGDVILVEDAVGVGGPGGPDDDWEITSSGNDVFTGRPGISISNLPQGNVGIGLLPAADAKLDVLQEKKPIGVNVLNTAPGFLQVIGTKSSATGSKDLNIGVYGFASNAGKNIGVFGQIPFGSSGFAGEFDGDINVIGSGFATGSFIPPSDERYKNNIVTIDSDSALNMVKQLRGVYFEWDTATFPEKRFTAGKKIGFIAQEVDSIIPEVIVVNDSGFFGIDYDRITPVLVEAIKKLKTEIDSLKNELAYNQSWKDSVETLLTPLMDCYNNLPPGLCNNNGNRSMGDNNEGDGEKSGERNKVLQPDSRGEHSILYQNIPNPFNKNTEIKYYLPKEVNNAAIIIYDLAGRQIKQFDSLQRGEGRVIINAGELYAGIFKYALIADGEFMKTKTMVLTK